ncbi:uncharacterized protein LOC142180921 [Nicotiana tabacum]|uniref:Uncharacterized protein LOC142180921 n=1 Tax=Nicotiana tabacum TaxID=4097 RepID=A0AC58UI16_TOBAC
MTQQLTLRLMHSETHVELNLTLVYAKCDRTERIELWDTLYAMASDMTVPWLVGGDFNVIWDEEEKYGGLPVSLIEVDEFRHYINTCNLTDLGFKGSIFTWWNGRSEEDCIFKRLDRCFGNNELQQTFPGLEITHLSKIGSDHCPMLLKCDIETPPIKKSFRFLNFWTKHETFKDVVKENWNVDFSANPFYIFNYKLKKLKQALSTGSKATYGDIFQKIAIHEEVIEEDHLIAEEAIKFYKDQFTETAVPNDFDILNHVSSMVYRDQHERLMSLPSNEEVKRAVMGLNEDSAGGLDGFAGAFYQTYWEIIEEDVVRMVKVFFCGQ